jgi:hypothetical protein
MCQVEARFGPFGDNINVDTREVHGLRQMYHGHENLFQAHPVVLLGDVGLVKAHFGSFEDSINLEAR